MFGGAGAGQQAQNELQQRIAMQNQEAALRAQEAQAASLQNHEAQQNQKTAALMTMGGQLGGTAMRMGGGAPTTVPAGAHGMVVPGKASVPGDSKKNDKVLALLSPDEIVLPRTVALAKDAPEQARKFVEGLLAKERSGR
jgi:hypothetical protein